MVPSSFFNKSGVIYFQESLIFFGIITVDQNCYKENIMDIANKNDRPQFNWSLIEPYLNSSFDEKQSTRKSKTITLKEYKNYILSGMTGVEITRNIGVSSDLIEFFSKMVQGKFIHVKKTDFERLYMSGESLNEISKKYKLQRSDTTFLRKLYEIKRLGHTYINRKKTEIPLTQRQIEILYGSMMGDAKRFSPSSAGFGQGTDQKDYLYWKYKEFESVASPKSLKTTSYITKHGTHCTDSRFYTFANTDIENCNNEFYTKDHGKQVTQNILNKLTPLSIAVWYMDDGQVDWGHRSIRKSQHHVMPTFKFCTDSFTKESIDLIQKWFLEKYNIKTRLQQRKNLINQEGYRVTVEGESNEIFINLIKPYILPYFQYKIDYKEYLKSRGDCSETDLLFADLLKEPIGNNFAILSEDQKKNVANKFTSYYQKLNGIIHINHKNYDIINEAHLNEGSLYNAIYEVLTEGSFADKSLVIGKLIKNHVLVISAEKTLSENGNKRSLAAKAAWKRNPNQGRTGNPLPEESREALSEKMKGHAVSEETRQKISEGLLKRIS